MLVCLLLSSVVDGVEKFLRAVTRFGSEMSSGEGQASAYLTPLRAAWQACAATLPGPICRSALIMMTSLNGPVNGTLLKD